MKLNKRGSDTIHDVIPTKYQKYSSKTIIKHAIFLDKLNKLPQGRLIYLPSHNAYSIPIHVRTMTLAEINHTKKE